MPLEALSVETQGVLLRHRALFLAFQGAGSGVIFVLLNCVTHLSGVMLAVLQADIALCPTVALLTEQTCHHSGVEQDGSDLLGILPDKRCLLIYDCDPC